MEEAARPAHSLLAQLAKVLWLLAEYLYRRVRYDSVAKPSHPDGYIGVFSQHPLGESIQLGEEVTPERNSRAGQDGDRINRSLRRSFESRAVVDLDGSHSLYPDGLLVRQRYRPDTSDGGIIKVRGDLAQQSP